MKKNNEEMIERIYKETLTLIFTYGSKGWTMDTVCKRSGIAKDTLYRIIGNKENLIKNAISKVLDKHSKKMTNLLNQDKDFFNTLRLITDHLSEFLSQFSLNKFSRIMLEYPSIESTINNAMEDFYQNFENFLNEGKKYGCIKKNVDTKLLVRIINASIIQFIKQPEDFDASRNTDMLLDYLIEGIKL